MSTRTPRTPRSRDEAAQLQYETEHTRLRPPRTIYPYLAILAAVAFFLLLMAYFMQARNNKVAMDTLQQTSSSAVQSVENLIAERDELKEQVARMQDHTEVLDAEIAALRRALEDANHETAAVRQETEIYLGRVDALNRLNQIRSLYNRNQYKAARALLGEAEERAALRAALEQITAQLTEDERSAYDPVSAYEALCGWLGVPS